MTFIYKILLLFIKNIQLEYLIKHYQKNRPNTSKISMQQSECLSLG